MNRALTSYNSCVNRIIIKRILNLALTAYKSYVNRVLNSSCMIASEIVFKVS